MDALIARADAIRPLSELKTHKSKDTKGKAKASSKGKSKETSSDQDFTLQSVTSHASLPKSLRVLPSSDPSSSKSKNDEVPKYNHIANKKLRNELVHQHTLNKSIAQSTLETQQNLLSLAADDAGSIQVTGPLEKTWRVSQDEIKASVGGEAAKGRRELTFRPGEGVKRMKWSRNGRHLVFISGKGGTKVSSVDWLGGNVNSEVDLLAGSNLSGAGGSGGGGECARDVTFLQDQSFYSVAQKRNVFIYDRDGVEVHRLSNIIDPLRLEFLPYHWLLVAVTNSGHLSYTDTTTGTQIAVHRTKLGASNTLTQNNHNAVVHLGHQNGCVTLWTPNLSKPAVQILAHLGPLTSISVNPHEGSLGSVNMPGRYMATAGRDGKVKIWDCRNWKGVVREWTVRGSGDVDLEWSQKGYLGVATGGSVNVYHPPHITTPHAAASSQPPLYLTHAVPHRPLHNIRFEPFSDVLAIGHNKGLSSILIPGAGEPQFDSLEADPFENAKGRREREVKGLLDKIQPDLITLDPSTVGKFDTAAVSASAAGSLMTTAAQSLLDKSDKAKWGANVQVKKVGVDVPFARMKRVERLAVQGKLDNIADEDSDGGSDVEMKDGSDVGGDDDEDGGMTKEEKDKKRKLRGRNKSLKRYLRKQRKNVVDPQVLAVRAKVDRMREEAKARKLQMKNGPEEPKRKSALDRFKAGSGK